MININILIIIIFIIKLPLIKSNPWKNSCKDGHDFQCMENLSSLFKCRNENKCMTYENCNNNEALYLSGRYCDGFPYYNFNGKFSNNNIIKKNEYNYTCLEYSTGSFIPSSLSNSNHFSSDSSSYCLKSHSKKSTVKQIELNTSYCLSSSTSQHYCNIWNEEKLIISKCWKDLLPSENFSREFCCGDKESKDHYCCNNDCNQSFYNSKNVIHVNETCKCIEESENKNYCLNWTCNGQKNKFLFINDIDHSNSTIERSLRSSYSNSYIVNKKYNLLEDNFISIDSNKTKLEMQYNVSSQYHCKKSNQMEAICTEWHGKTKSIENTILFLCLCDDFFCQKYNCYTKTIYYIWPNILWSIFTIILCLFPIIFYYFIIDEKYQNKKFFTENNFYNNLISFIIFNLWCSMFFTIGIWQGGLSVLFISLAFLLIIIILLFFKFLIIFLKNNKRIYRIYLEPVEINQTIIRINDQNNIIKIAKAELVNNDVENIQIDDIINVQSSSISSNFDCLPVANQVSIYYPENILPIR